MMDGALRATLAALEERGPQLRGRSRWPSCIACAARSAASCEGTFEELRRESFRRVLAARGVHDADLPGGWWTPGWTAG